MNFSGFTKSFKLGECMPCLKSIDHIDNWFFFVCDAVQKEIQLKMVI